MDPNRHNHLQLIVSLLSLLPSTLASCSRKCGNITVPFPFGTSPGCHLSRPSNFLLNCNLSSSPPSLTLPTDPPLELSHIDLLSSFLYVKLPVSFLCLHPNSTSSSRSTHYDLSSLPYSLSLFGNAFVVVGCDVLGVYSFNEGSSGCLASCAKPRILPERGCTGEGCCRTTTPPGLNVISVGVSSFSNYSGLQGHSRCGAAFFMDLNKGDVDDERLFNATELAKAERTVALEWSVGNMSCEEARGSSACGSFNSVCYHPVFRPGYLCRCAPGFSGNAYLPGGCQPIFSNSNRRYVTTSLLGLELIHPLRRIVGGSVFGFLLLLSCIIFFLIHQRRNIRRQKKRVEDLKRKMFEQNGGLVLQQLIASTPGSSFKLFSQAELIKATEGFKEINIIGRGGHGVVFKGELDSGLTVAIKKSRAMNERESKEFAREMAILSQINHVNIVKILGCCLEVEIPMLVYEFIPGGTLFSFIHGQSLIALSTRLRLAREVAEALAYLHCYASPPIFHKDVKTLNVLLDGSLKAKISDFGASVVVAADEVEVATVVQGTCGYLDPEYLQTYQFTEKSDVYSFGVVLVELITRRKPFQVQNEVDFKGLAATFVERHINGRLSEIVDPQILGEREMVMVTEVADLACRCLSLRGVDRPTMKQVAMALHRIEGCEDDTPLDGGDSLRSSEISMSYGDLEEGTSGYTGSTAFTSLIGR